LVAAELGHVSAMARAGMLLTKAILNDLFGSRAAANGNASSFLNGMSDQIQNFNNGTGHAKVVFVIGRALKGHINNEKRKIFGDD
jgi:hypothetical protein